MRGNMLDGGLVRLRGTMTNAHRGMLAVTVKMITRGGRNRVRLHMDTGTEMGLSLHDLFS